MNPLLPASEVARAYADDPVRAASEFGAEFRSSSSNLIDADVLQSCIAQDVVERERVPGRRYFAFVDAADGRANGDSMTLAISHCEGRMRFSISFASRGHRSVPSALSPASPAPCTASACAGFRPIVTGAAHTRSYFCATASYAADAP